jgi:hypothetical protein
MLIDCSERIRFNRKMSVRRVGWFQRIVSKFKHSIVIGLVILAVGARMNVSGRMKWGCMSIKVRELQ